MAIPKSQARGEAIVECKTNDIRDWEKRGRGKGINFLSHVSHSSLATILN